jgi:type VI secretion system protein VasD
MRAALGLVRSVGLLSILCPLIGCGTAAAPPPTVVDLAFTAADDVNPDSENRASPILVRCLQLVTTSTFEKADYFQLHDGEKAILGQDILDAQNIALPPGAAKELSFDAKPATKFIGIIASYRDIDRATWRAVVPVPAQPRVSDSVRLDRLAVIVAPNKK